MDACVFGDNRNDFGNVLACRGLSFATGGRVTFLLRGQEKSNQKRRPPCLALAGRPARQVREARSGFSTAHPCTGEK